MCQSALTVNGIYNPDGRDTHLLACDIHRGILLYRDHLPSPLLHRGGPHDHFILEITVVLQSANGSLSNSVLKPTVNCYNISPYGCPFPSLYMLQFHILYTIRQPPQHSLLPIYRVIQCASRRTPSMLWPRTMPHKPHLTMRSATMDHPIYFVQS